MRLKKTITPAGVVWTGLSMWIIRQNDVAGNRIKTEQARLGVNVAPVQKYQYDSLDRLVGATRPVLGNGTESFQYDAVGNRVRRDGETEDAEFNINNQLVQDQKFAYVYDLNGNLIEKTDRASGAVTRFVWDSEDRLVKVTKHNSAAEVANSTITYAYDAIGRRTQKNVDGVKTQYAYDGEDVVLAFDPNRGTLARYIHGPGIDEPLYANNGTEIYMQQDQLGSVIALTDRVGNIVQSYAYDAYGNQKVFDASGQEIQPSQGTFNPYAFTGRELDPETGLQYHRARYYDQKIGRWLSEEPTGQDGPNL